MLKRLLYTNRLIDIGNSVHYNGEAVWSDGRVAYGWDYAKSKAPATVIVPAGFWVGEETNGKYRLAKKNLLLGNTVVSNGHGDLQCYPCYVDVQDTGGNLPEYGILYSPNGVYLFDGAVISLDASGNVLTYKGYMLKFFTNTNAQKQDTNHHPLFYAHVVATTLDLDDWYYVAIYSNNNINYFTIYDTDLIKIAEVTEQNDTFNIVYNYDGRQITDSDADFEIIKKYNLLNVVETTVDLYSLYAMGGTVTLNHIVAIDAIRLNIDDTTVQGLIGQNERGNTVRKYFQLATAIQTYLCAYSPDRDVDGDIKYSGGYEVVYDMLIDSGVCTLTVGANGVTIYDVQTGTEIAHTSGDLLTVGGTYVGHGRITYDNYNNGEWNYELWLYIDGMTGTANIEYDVNNYCIVTNHQTGDTIAQETSTGLDVYYGGVVAWQGPGSISVSNVTPIEYTGDYLVSSDITGSSNQITNPLGDPTVTDGTLYAEQNGSTITITDNGSPVYSGAGSITITNPQPAAGGYYSGSYTISIRMSGSGIIVPQGSSDMDIYDSNRDIVASLASGNVSIYDSSGTVTYTGAGTITTNNLVPVKWFGGYTLNASVSGTETVVIKDKVEMCDYTITRTITGHSYHIEQPTGDTVVYYKDKVATYDRNNSTVRIVDASHQVVYSGTGSISAYNLVDTEGDYTITLTATGFGYASKDTNNNTYVYDLNNNLVAKEQNREIIIYSGGQVEYQGAGTITLSNTVQETDTVVVYDSNGNVIAEENGDDVDVYDANQQLIYSGTGWIKTSNIYAINIKRSNKLYHIDASNGLQQVQQYPTSWQDGGVTLDLSDMSLTVDQHTYNNDPLRLLNTHGFIFAHGVHGNGDYVISQDSNLLWHCTQQHTTESETYSGIEHVFNLAWLRKRWKS